MRALVCPLSSAGFQHPATAAALELHRRGHDVSLFAAGGAARAAEAAGIAVLPSATAREPHAFEVSRWFRDGDSQYRVVLAAARALRPDVIVTSVLCPGALLAAETLDLPAVVIGLACHLWPYAPEAATGAAGGTIGGTADGTGCGPADGTADGTADGGPDAEDRRWRLTETVKHHQGLRAKLGLPRLAAAEAERHLLGRAFLLRGHPGLERPGAKLPAGVRHVGPLWWEPPYGPEDRFTEDALTSRIDRVGKPLVYVHLGRTFGGESLWPWIDRAFTGTGRQAVVELARTDDREPAPGSDVMTVRQPRMSELLRRAEAVVANGTSAPVLGALLHARPLLVRPNGGEQRLLAAACLRAGVAARLPGSQPAGGGDRLGTSAPVPDLGEDPLGHVMADPGLRARATALGTELAQAKSAVLAAQEIEDAAR